jgi:hypothetical protein
MDMGKKLALNSWRKPSEFASRFYRTTTRRFMDAKIRSTPTKRSSSRWRKRSPARDISTRAKRMLVNRNHLFTFLTHEGVGPTNNRAEQALRPPVQWRKFRFDNQSDPGEGFTERILTVFGTTGIRDGFAEAGMLNLIKEFDGPVPFHRKGVRRFRLTFHERH